MPDELQLDPVKEQGLRRALQQLYTQMVSDDKVQTVIMLAPFVGAAAAVLLGQPWIALLVAGRVIEGVSINILSEKLLKLGKGGTVPNDELVAAFQQAINGSKIDQLLTQDAFYTQIARLVNQIQWNDEQLRTQINAALSALARGEQVDELLKMQRQIKAMIAGQSMALNRIEGKVDRLDRASWEREPYHSYLVELKRFAEDYIQRYVLEMMSDHDQPLPLDPRPTPGAVEATVKRQMGRSFYAMRGDDPPAAPTPEKFESFDEVFAVFGGRVLLLGEPGAGKSTTLMTFARDAALTCQKPDKSGEPLPIIARIATWNAEEKTPVAEWLAEQSDGALTAEQIARLIEEGRALLLLDGLDELGGVREEPHPLAPPPQAREGEQDAPPEKFDPRRAFMAMLPAGGPVVVTCRRKDYEEIGTKIGLGGAVTLQPLSPAQIEDYLSATPDLWAAIKADDGLLDVASTPLLLSYFAYAFRDLPEETRKLRDLSKGEVRTRIFDHYVRERYDYEERNRRHNVPIERAEMERVLEEVAYANFGDWFANLLFRRDFDRAAGDASLADQIIAQARVLHLLTVDEPSFVHLLLRDHFAVPAAMRAFSDADPTVRSKGARVLSRIGDSRAVGLLIPALGDEDKEVRRSAAHILGQIGDARAVEPLIAALKDAEENVRSRAVWALGQIGDARALEPLLTVLGYEDTFVRLEAADALMKIGPPAFAALFSTLEDEDEKVRWSAAYGLRSIGDRRAVDPLIRALSDPNRLVREFAAQALWKIGDARAVEPLIRALGDEQQGVRSYAALALQEMGAPALAPLIAALASDNEDVRLGASIALAEIGQGAVEPLIRALRDDEDARPYAAAGLIMIGPAAVEPLITLLNDADADADVRDSAADALELIGTPEALAAVEEYPRRQQGG